MTWKPGQSGNRKGRPVGSRHKASLIAQQLLDGEAEIITRKAIELAKGGDVTCIRLCLERLLAVKKDHPIGVKLPTATCAQDLPGLVAKILALATNGDITPAEAKELCAIVESSRRVIETAELEARVEELKRRVDEHFGEDRRIE